MFNILFQDVNSSAAALNRLQGTILYSSSEEGMRLEYPLCKILFLPHIFDWCKLQMFSVQFYLAAHATHF